MFYSNRSACYLKVSNHHGSLQDSSKALELLVPATKSNAQARIKAHVRRAACLVELGMIREALGEFDEAIRITGEGRGERNEALEKDRETVRHMLLKEEEEEEIPCTDNVKLY